jgi:hypothetical protein
MRGSCLRDNPTGATIPDGWAYSYYYRKVYCRHCIDKENESPKRAVVRMIDAIAKGIIRTEHRLHRLILQMTAPPPPPSSS